MSTLEVHHASEQPRAVLQLDFSLKATMWSIGSRKLLPGIGGHYPREGEPLAADVWLAGLPQQKIASIRSQLLESSELFITVRIQNRALELSFHKLDIKRQVAYICTVTDVSAERENKRQERQERTEAALRIRQLEQQVNLLPQPLLLTDSAFNLTAVNPAMLRLLGRRKRDLLGKNLQQAMPEGELQPLVHAAIHSWLHRTTGSTMLHLRGENWQMRINVANQGLAIEAHAPSDAPRLETTLHGLLSLPDSLIVLSAELSVLHYNEAALATWHKLFQVVLATDLKLLTQANTRLRSRLKRLRDWLSAGHSCLLFSRRGREIWAHRVIPVLSGPLQLERIIVQSYLHPDIIQPKASSFELERFFEQAPAGLALAHEDGTILLANRVFRQLISEPQIDGVLRQESIRLEDGQVNRQFLQANQQQVELLLVKYHGQHMPAAFACVALDVTDKSLVEAQIRLYLGLFQSLFEHSPDGLILAEVDSLQVLEVNDKCLELLSKERNKVLRRSLDKVLALPETLKQQLNKCAQVAETEMELPPKSQNRWVHVLIRSIEGPAGQRQYLVRIVDITERRNMTERIIQVQELERKRIAEDLHDSLGQMLSAAKLNLTLLQRQTNVPSQDLKGLAELLDSAVDEVRAIATHLLPVSLRDFGLGKALQALQQRVENIGRLPCTLQVLGEHRRLAHAEEVNLYRIAQEAVGNCLKHASPSSILILLHFTPETVELQIRDDGIGFDVTVAQQQRRGMGLENMLMRSEQIGSNLTIRSDPTEGTRVRVNLALQLISENTELASAKP
jgi:PAS domain S-box-containing protein